MASMLIHAYLQVIHPLMSVVTVHNSHFYSSLDQGSPVNSWLHGCVWLHEWTTTPTPMVQFWYHVWYPVDKKSRGSPCSHILEPRVSIWINDPETIKLSHLNGSSRVKENLVKFSKPQVKTRITKYFNLSSVNPTLTQNDANLWHSATEENLRTSIKYRSYSESSDLVNSTLITPSQMTSRTLGLLKCSTSCVIVVHHIRPMPAKPYHGVPNSLHSKPRYPTLPTSRAEEDQRNCQSTSLQELKS